MPCAPMFPKLWAMDEGGFVSVLRRPDTGMVSSNHEFSRSHESTESEIGLCRRDSIETAEPFNQRQKIYI